MKKKMITIHCSAISNPRITAKDIDDIHRVRGFRKIGYHWFIRTDGTIEKGREEDERGAHALGGNQYGKYNDISIGICLNGLYKEDFTPEQFEACARLIKDIRKRHEILTIEPHNASANKLCPVFNIVDEIYPRLYEARFQRD